VRNRSPILTNTLPPLPPPCIGNTGTPNARSPTQRGREVGQNQRLRTDEFQQPCLRAQPYQDTKGAAEARSLQQRWPPAGHMPAINAACPIKLAVNDDPAPVEVDDFQARRQTLCSNRRSPVSWPGRPATGSGRRIDGQSRPFGVVTDFVWLGDSRHGMTWDPIDRGGKIRPRWGAVARPPHFRCESMKLL
jgi:hypothetical protein